MKKYDKIGLFSIIFLMLIGSVIIVYYIAYESLNLNIDRDKVLIGSVVIIAGLLRMLVGVIGLKTGTVYGGLWPKNWKIRKEESPRKYWEWVVWGIVLGLLVVMVGFYIIFVLD